jgi:hypothetical protein
MRSLGIEQILLLLVLVAVPLLNLLVRWLRHLARAQHQAPAERRPAETDASHARPSAALPPGPRVADRGQPQEAPRRAAPAPPPPVIRRAGLLHGRAAVRRAVVAMTILGPCRAMEEQPPMPPSTRGTVRESTRMRT